MFEHDWSTYLPSIIVIELIYEKILGGVKLTPSLNMTSDNPVLLGLMLYISYKHSIFACVCGGKVVGVCACGCGGGSIIPRKNSIG